MTSRNLPARLLALLLSVPLAGLASGDTPPLSLQEAIALAIADEPGVAAHEARARGYEEQAVAQGQLPDPKLKLGLANFPTDTFSRTQEPMTQVQVGVVQMFPRGDTRAIKARQHDARAAKTRHAADNERRVARRDVSHDWLDLYYWLRAESIIEQSRHWFSHLAEVTEKRYRNGVATQQEVVQASLERDRLDDRLEDIRLQQGKARAALRRWVGPAGDRPLRESLPLIEVPEYAGRETLEQHPVILAHDEEIRIGDQEVELNRQSYKPGWALDVTYGGRSGDNPDGSSRADFLSAMVLVDVPLFTDKRQDRDLAASARRLEAQRMERDKALREMRSRLDEVSVQIDVLARQAKLHEERLIVQSEQHAELALRAYENNRAEFDTVMRARIAALETRLKALKLAVDEARARTTLVYLAGGEQ